MSATLSGCVVGDGGAGIAGLRVVIRDETACMGYQERKQKAPLCGAFAVAGAGFEPATSGL
jgi:hypothetical protein